MFQLPTLTNTSSFKIQINFKMAVSNFIYNKMKRKVYKKQSNFWEVCPIEI